MSELFARYAAMIRSASDLEIMSDATLDGRLMIERSGDLTISYAPFDHINPSARVVILGITPGVHQAKCALGAARRELLSGQDHATALAAAKVFASFSGPMRSNLVAMLDLIGVADWLGIQSTDALWDGANAKAHFTSALRYPVFLDGKNYAGSPSMTSTPFLRRYLEDFLAPEAIQLADALWVPLGPRATEAARWLVGKGILNAARLLEGIPHPSGANSERIAYFLGRKARQALSSKTNPVALDRAREQVTAKVAAALVASK